MAPINPATAAWIFMVLVLAAPSLLAVLAVRIVSPHSGHAFSVVATGVVVAGFAILPLVWLRSKRWPASLDWTFLLKQLMWAFGFGMLVVIGIVGLAWMWLGVSDGYLAFRLMGWEFLIGFWLYLALAGAIFVVRSEQRRMTHALAASDAKYAALISKVRPHFLFNTLTSVAELVAPESVRAERAIEDLSTLFRRAIDLDTTATVTLKEELDFVERYLALEALRLGERLHVSTQVEPGTTTCHVPPYSVQALVENAIRHGVSPSPNGGEIKLVVKEVSQCVEIAVHDNGAGATSETVRKSTGIGLTVVRDMLRARFGEAAHLDIDTSPGHGFQAKITVPRQ